MALSLSDINLVRQRTFGETRKPKVQAILKALFSYLAQHKGSPDLQIVAFADLTSGTGTAIADAACRVHAIFVKKPSASTVSAYFKGSDSPTTASATAPEFSMVIPSANEDIVVFPDGLSMANGFAIRSDTTAAGSTGSVAADQPDGFVIVGAP